VSADFPETAEVTALAQFMVGIDERWDRMKAVREAKWSVPAAHPDVDPPHEALQLAEQYHEAGRLPAVTERPEEFRRWLAEAEEDGKRLEAALRRKPADAPAAEQQFQRLAASCTQCHRKYRDVPQRP
jgi:cytochrome c556